MKYYFQPVLINPVPVPEIVFVFDWLDYDLSGYSPSKKLQSHLFPNFVAYQLAHIRCSKGFTSVHMGHNVSGTNVQVGIVQR